jgi:hypothetical protein
VAEVLGPFRILLGSSRSRSSPSGGSVARTNGIPGRENGQNSPDLSKMNNLEKAPETGSMDKWLNLLLVRSKGLEPSRLLGATTSR